MTIKVSQDPHDKWEEASASQSIHWLYRSGVLNFDIEAVMSSQYSGRMISNYQQALQTHSCLCAVDFLKDTQAEM